MHMFNKERKESCHTEAGYLHLHCMNFYHDSRGTYLEAHNHDDKGTSSANGTIGIIIIGVIIILVVFCMVLMLYELFKYRAKRLIVNSHVAVVRRTRPRRQQYRRNIQEGPLPYLSRPPNYDDLCLSDKELPSFEDATTET